MAVATNDRISRILHCLFIQTGRFALLRLNGAPSLIIL